MIRLSANSNNENPSKREASVQLPIAANVIVWENWTEISMKMTIVTCRICEHAQNSTSTCTKVFLILQHKFYTLNDWDFRHCSYWFQVEVLAELLFFLPILRSHKIPCMAMEFPSCSCIAMHETGLVHSWENNMFGKFANYFCEFSTARSE